ncbi:hypothetical protein D3C81_1127950 [compost metagenome]
MFGLTDITSLMSCSCDAGSVMSGRSIVSLPLISGWLPTNTTATSAPLAASLAAWNLSVTVSISKTSALIFSSSPFVTDAAPATLISLAVSSALPLPTISSQVSLFTVTGISFHVEKATPSLPSPDGRTRNTSFVNHSQIWSADALTIRSSVVR